MNDIGIRTLFISPSDDTHTKRNRINAVMNHMDRCLEEGVKFRVRIDADTMTNAKKRTLEQNAKLQALCRDVAEQVNWYDNKLDVDDWRHMFVAAYKKELRTVPGIHGGFVVLGASSRTLTTQELSDVIEIIQAFGSEHSVRWSA